MMCSKLVVAASLLGVLGCDKTPAPDMTKAVEAQRAATQEIGIVRQEGADKIGAARQDAIKAQDEANKVIAHAQQEAAEKASASKAEASEALHEGQSDSANAQEKANDKIRAANHDVTQAQNEVTKKSAEAQAKANKAMRTFNEDEAATREGLRTWTRKRMDEIDGVMDDARAKASSATGARRSEFDKAMREAESKRAALRNELATLDTQSADALSGFQTNVHTHADELKKRVDQMRSAL